MRTYRVAKDTFGFIMILVSISIHASAAEYPQKLTWEEALISLTRTSES